ncbi:hypothetical protein P12x_002253 [Tundrisphaera lichenicola]|uniref:hypothetical protein n=1 Tax=Tundrisphaera lichenicola TaxID=2029860 RepID=UPI003EB98120
MRRFNPLSTALLLLFATLSTLMAMALARDSGSSLPGSVAKAPVRTLPAKSWRPIPANPWDCRLAITLPQATFDRGERICPRLVLTNGSSEPVTIWVSTFASNHRIELFDSGGNEVPLTELGEQARDRFAPRGGRDKNYRVVIPAGGCHEEGTPPDLSQLYRLGSGRFQVKITYHDEQGPTPMKVASNSLAFEVR